MLIEACIFSRPRTWIMSKNVCAKLPTTVSIGISWKEIAELQSALLRCLGNDQFIASLLEGIMTVGSDTANPIRGNLAASALRELVGSILQLLAPEQEIRRCAWFAQHAHTQTVTRRQRAKYIIYAGLSDTFVEKTLNLDIDTPITLILHAMDSLHRASHVRPKTILHKDREVRAMTRDVLISLLSLLNAATEIRDQLRAAIEGVMEHALFDRLTMNTISELDELSTHMVVYDLDIDSMEVQDLNATEVKYLISGKVDVDLQYGSNADVCRDIGFRKSDSFLYHAEVSSDVTEPLEIESRDLEVTIDTNSFFE